LSNACLTKYFRLYAPLEVIELIKYQLILIVLLPFRQDYAKAEERDPFLGRPGSTASSSQSHGHQMSTLTRNQGSYYYPLFISHPTPAQHAQNRPA